LVRELTNKANVAIIFVNYTPSPEAKYPIALEQAYTMSYKISGSNVSGNVTNVALTSSTGGRFMDIALFQYAPLQGLLTEGGGTLEGNFTSANLLNRLAGKQMSDLVNMINDGIVYVRVQTVDNPLLGEMGGKVQPAPQ
jgi:alpha/beta hydrolase fold